MTEILHPAYWNAFRWKKNAIDPFNKMSALVQVTACHRTGNKSIHGTVMTEFNDVSLDINDSKISTLRPRQNGRHFPDDLYKCIFLNENVWISIKISLKFIPKCPIDNIPALVQIMAWRRLGDKPLSEPMIVRLPTHICATRPQWVNTTICD